MTITDVKIRRIFNDKSDLKAIVSVTIDDCLAIHDVKIIHGHTRLFIAMPSQKNTSGKYRDVVHPIGDETRKSFEDAIFSAYNAHITPLPF